MTGTYPDADTSLSILPFDTSADGVQPVFDVFVTAVDLVDVVDLACSFGRHSGNEHGNTGTYIRRSHVIAFQLARMVMPYHHRPVRIAENDLCSHINQFVHKEEPGFEHLLVNEHRSFRLRSNHQEDREQIRRETGPRCICNREDRAVKERLNLVVFLRRNNKIVAVFVNAYS